MNETVFGRFIFILTNPGVAMDQVRDNPRWTAAALVIVACVAIYSGVTLHITGPEQVELLQETRFGEMMEAEQIEEMYAQFDNITMKTRILSGMQAGFATLISVLISTLVYLLFSRLSGGQGSFKQLLGVVMWASVVGLGVHSLAKIPLVLMKGSSMDVSLGLGVLAASRGPLDAVYQFLSMFDVFSLWALALVVLGLERIHGFNRNKATMVGVSGWLLIAMSMFGLGRLVM